MRLVLIRHPAPAIAAGICYGRLDVPLTQAEQHSLAQRSADPILQGAKRVRSSPARRCLDLASAIARRWQVELIVDRRLLELDFGEWEGRRWDDVSRTCLDEWAASPATFKPPGGESAAALVQRVNACFSDLCDDGQDCIIVSHGGPLKILLDLLARRPIDLLGLPPPIGSVTISQHPRQ